MNIPDHIRQTIRPRCQVCNPPTTGTHFLARLHCDKPGCGKMLCPAHAVSGSAGDGCPEHHVELGITPHPPPGIVVVRGGNTAERPQKHPSSHRNGPLAPDRNPVALPGRGRERAVEGQLDTLTGIAKSDESRHPEGQNTP